MAGFTGLDFETYGAVDLNRHGLHRYVGDKSFMPLIGSVSFKDGSRYRKLRFDFVNHRKQHTLEVRDIIGSDLIVAHNAPFEHAVLSWLGLDYPFNRFIDSAVVARAAGAGSRLEAAAPQLLNIDKMEDGRRLINLFSRPGKYQEENGNRWFDPRIIADHPEDWNLFGDYCDLDSELGLRIVDENMHYLTVKEERYAAITMEMNHLGWPVDHDMVMEMQARYLENQAQALQDFLAKHNVPNLNLNSLKQMKEFCLDRGIKATSFDEKHVASLKGKIEKRMTTMVVDSDKDQERYENYAAVVDLLTTKQILGGSSLKKLQTILDTEVEDWTRPGKYVLRDQYVHIGAAATWRTSGRSAQMQNLKRLGENPDDMEELLEDPDAEWDNDKLAKNIRQVFTASDPNGFLLVGDFSSVESRGLAWLSDELWKVTAYRQGKKIYELQAARMFNCKYEDITKTDPRRQAGKVGELSCGYGAGGEAVRAFGANMGVELTEAEAAKLVKDWREANPHTVQFWQHLDEMLHAIVERNSPREALQLQDNMVLILTPVPTPASLLKQHPGAMSVQMRVEFGDGTTFLKRVFHGCYVRGRNIGYYKPSDRKTGDLWKNHYTDQKTKQVKFYSLYGGKLAGILTQSFCRELFMQSMEKLHTWCSHTGGQVRIIGQFHDEIVVDWKPGAISREAAILAMEQAMSDPGRVRSFPLAADIKCDYRYTK